MKKHIGKKPLNYSTEYYDLPPAKRYYLKHEIKNLQVSFWYNFDGTVVLELTLR